MPTNDWDLQPKRGCQRGMRLRWLLIMLWVVFGVTAFAGRTCAAENAHGNGKTPNPIEHVLDEEILIVSGYKIMTKYMVLELIAALLILVIFIPLARRARSGEPPRGG